MIIQLFNYIFQIIFSIFEKEFNNLNQIIFSKDNTIAKLNKTILILKDKIKELNTDNENLIICETSISPSYLPFEVDIAPLSVEVVKPTLNYKNLIKGKIFKTSKCVKNKTLPYPEQVCPKCSSPYEYHSRHSKNQKKCKCCNAHFNIEKMRKHTHNSFYCPYCKKALSLRAKRTSFDVYVWIIYDHDKETKGAIASFELWMLYYNYLRIIGDSTINSLEFIDKRINTSNLLMPMKWIMIIKYTIQNYVT